MKVFTKSLQFAVYVFAGQIKLVVLFYMKAFINKSYFKRYNISSMKNLIYCTVGTV